MRKNKVVIFCATFLIVMIAGTAALFLKKGLGMQGGMPETPPAENPAGEEADVLDPWKEPAGDPEETAVREEDGASGDPDKDVVELGFPSGEETGEAGSSDGPADLEAETDPYEAAKAAALERLSGKVPADRILVPETKEQGVITFSFAGDILFDRGYAVYATYLQRGSELEKCISPDLLARMRGADVMMINNEFPYTDRGAPTPDKQFTFHAATDSVHLLEEMGVDIVTLANNHASDYGQISLLDTFDTLEGAGMPYLGAGRNLEEASRPYYYVCGGYTVAVVSATQIERYANPSTPGATKDSPGTFRCFDPENLLACIEEAKENSDFVILYIHWGTESTDVLDWAQTSQAPLYAQAGADLIIGCHPHVLQEVGYVGGVPVVYSLGNFWFNSKTLDSCLVTATLRDGRLESLQFEPCLQSGCSVKLLSGAEKMRVINYMRGISETALIDDDGYIRPKE